MNLSDFHTITELLAFAAATAFFVYKLVDGWGIVNLSIELDAARKSTRGSDIVAVTLRLSKGGSGSLLLDTVELRCELSDGTSENCRIPLNYRLGLRDEERLDIADARVQWEVVDHTRPRIYLPPGESTQYSHMFSVPKGKSCTVQAIVIGKRPVSTRRGQWRASVAVP
jgi:hypothetical protein